MAASAAARSDTAAPGPSPRAPADARRRIDCVARSPCRDDPPAAPLLDPCAASAAITDSTLPAGAEDRSSATTLFALPSVSPRSGDAAPPLATAAAGP